MLPPSAGKKLKVQIFNLKKEIQSFPEIWSLPTLLHCSIKQTTIILTLATVKPSNVIMKIQFSTKETVKFSNNCSVFPAHHCNTLSVQRLHVAR